jgi:hypothetical protein
MTMLSPQNRKTGFDQHWLIAIGLKRTRWCSSIRPDSTGGSLGAKLLRRELINRNPKATAIGLKKASNRT